MVNSPVGKSGSVSPLFYGIFFLSGAASLLYQIVWVRQFTVFFGSSTHSVVAVITAFLGGLALGSALFGRFAQRRSPSALLRLYGWLEICTGLSAAATILLVHWIVPLYQNFSDGSTLSPQLLILKFLLTIPCLLVPTTLMGGTLPVMVGALRRVFPRVDQAFSILYAVNTFGAVTGVLVSAFVLIESFGLRTTLFIAVGVNCLVGMTALWLRLPAANERRPAVQPETAGQRLPWAGRDRMIILILGCTGFIAIALEVLWSRMLIPATGTAVYAFAIVLAMNLLGIALGSLMYHTRFRNSTPPPLTFPVAQFVIGVFTVVMALVYGHIVFDGVALIILFVTTGMGLAFPTALSLLSEQATQRGAVGWAYAVNTVGAIAGGVVANYLLIPYFGSGRSVVLCSILSIILAAVFADVWRDRLAPARQRQFIRVFSTVMIVVLGSTLVLAPSLFADHATRKYRALAAAEGGTVRSLEDEVASVVGYGNAQTDRYSLLVDGVGITALGIETKMMAYLPLAVHPAPHRMLVICFGMGSTFRASVVAGMTTDAVELSPSVAKMFPLFYADAEAILANPRSAMIVNDGRNYAALTKQTYDTMTIDPPPPFYAAGTTVLYAKEFYAALKQRLTPGGIVSQWVYYANSRRDDIAPAIKAFTDSFAYVLAYTSLSSNAGIHLLGSDAPIALTDAGYQRIFGQAVVQADLATVQQTVTPQNIADMFVADRARLVTLLQGYRAVTDDHPRTEYFMLRHLRHREPMMTHALMRSPSWGAD